MNNFLSAQQVREAIEAHKKEAIRRKEEFARQELAKLTQHLMAAYRTRFIMAMGTFKKTYGDFDIARRILTDNGYVVRTEERDCVLSVIIEVP